VGKKVLILTSARTFSGGEGLSYNMQAMKVAQTVGEITGGGANPGGRVPLGPGFTMFLPNGRPESPVTHTNWEGKGVIPDFATPAQNALRVALEKLGRTTALSGIDELTQARLFEPRPQVLPRNTAMAGTEAALRQVVEGLSTGKPRYETMSPEVAEITKAQIGQLQQMVGGYGALKSVAFKGGDAGGHDFYEVAFDKGALRFTIGLNGEGKLSTIFFRPSE
jgi:hypothetical protein